MTLAILESQEDNSVNWVDKKESGFFEARYVRRYNHYFSLYLSSQTGCDQACRQCHLTATKQTKAVNARRRDILNQAQQVLTHYRIQEPARMVHYNFMARGEPLLNPTVNDRLLVDLGEMARSLDLSSRFCISTIMPRELSDKRLSQRFLYTQPDFYYSLHSLNPSFRKKWLPKAMEVNQALDMFVQWQRDTGKLIKLHWAYIKGENDSVEDTEAIAEKIIQKNLRVNINIVRYNPFSAKYGEESPFSTISRNANFLANNLPTSNVKIISRVGMDVKASCGTFVV